LRDLIVHPEVAEALDDGTPIVALESAVITAGLPVAPHKLAAAANVTGWNDSEPTNLEAARAMAQAVRESGAVPAITAVLDGAIHIGLPLEQLPALVEKADGAKATVRDISVLMTKRASAGTTVAGTLRACALLNKPALCVMATGGIGGVHHTWPTIPDVSADLMEIARTPMCIVCAGPKSVLNVRATLEMLETLSVPVIGFGTDKLPAFYLRELDNLLCQARFDTPEEVAALCSAHWNATRSPTGVIVAQPMTEAVALEPAVLERALREAVSAAGAIATTGATVTPNLLREIARQTHGRSLDANISLLVHNAHLAGRLAAAFTPK
jgi:pseudouridine-5'-phosphate glycosidase